MTLDSFLDAVASRRPTPGGGAVAAATGALASALGSMVVAYSIGRDDLAEHRADLDRASDRLARARTLLLALGDEDARAYAWLSELLALPKDNPRRRGEFSAALVAAIDVPGAVVAAAGDLLRLLDSLGPISNRHLRSDLAVCAVLLEATGRAAAWNVRINLPLVDDPDLRGQIASGLDADLHRQRDLAERIERFCAA